MELQRVLVTGAAGFLGLPSYRRAAHRRAYGGGRRQSFLPAISQTLNILRQNLGFCLVEHDITRAFDSGHVDYIFNFASPASPDDYHRLGVETLLVGSAGTINTLDIARKYGASYLHASTSECNGDPRGPSSSRDVLGERQSCSGHDPSTMRRNASPRLPLRPTIGTTK